MRFAVDTGGTFTDLVIADSGHLRLFKAPTTPDAPEEGVIDVFGVAADALGLSLRDLLAAGDRLVHGTTTATNAVITGRTARTAFLTTAGHPDILVLREGGRIGLPLFDHAIPYPEPYIPRALTFEIPERIGPDGTVIAPLDEEAARAVFRRLADLAVEAVAICLLWSIANPEHERRLEALASEILPGVPVSLSHRVNPSLREYRRASATAIDASLKPVMGAYLGNLENRLRAEGFAGRLFVVTSQGAMKDAAEVAVAPIHTVKSGPAMAPVAGRHYLRAVDPQAHGIVADTGGTTYDVALIRHNDIPETRETWIGQPYRGHMTGFPSVDIRSVGAGGGSIAHVDAAGLLHVGPQSTGAVPGPACYGRGGTQATVTDAALVLGHIDPGHFLGGSMRLDPAAARAAIEEHVAAPLGLPPMAAAEAVMALATETMAGAIEDITVNQGIDPRQAVLIGGGGAAGLNSVAIARRLGCRRVLFPDAGAAISGVGGHLCPLSDELAAFALMRSRTFDRDTANRVLADLGARCAEALERLGESDGVTTFSVEARYAQQIWEIKLPLQAGTFAADADVTRLREDFHRLHREIFAFEDREGEIEFVAWRARVAADLGDAPLGRLEETAALSHAASREVWFRGAAVTVPVLSFADLETGAERQGPAIVETPLTTLVIDPGTRFHRHVDGSILVDVGQGDGA